jgi:hypothetical protein
MGAPASSYATAFFDHACRATTSKQGYLRRGLILLVCLNQRGREEQEIQHSWSSLYGKTIQFATNQGKPLVMPSVDGRKYWNVSWKNRCLT